jgi:non-heme chloroperoxidase
MSYIKTKDDNKLYVKTWGSGRPVILLHGWPLSADTWDEAAMAIAAAGFRTIAYDRRGFGRSTQPYDGYDYDTLTDDLAAVMESTGAKDATLVGFSMGGGEVARYMSRYQGKNVIKAGLISSVVPYLPKADDNPKGVNPKAFEKMTEGMMKDRAHFWGAFFKDFYGGKASDEVMEWSRKLAMEASFKATLDCAKGFTTTDFRPDLAAFSVPTLIIHGTADKTVPIDPSARAAAAKIRDAKLIEYEGSPHGLFVTDKERLHQDLVDFVQS